jgi:hypothetical protein
VFRVQADQGCRTGCVREQKGGAVAQKGGGCNSTPNRTAAKGRHASYVFTTFKISTNGMSLARLEFDWL